MLKHVENHGDALTDTDAHGAQCVTTVTPMQLMAGSQCQAATTISQRMA